MYAVLPGKQSTVERDWLTDGDLTPPCPLRGGVGTMKDAFLVSGRSPCGARKNSVLEAYNVGVAVFMWLAVSVFTNVTVGIKLCKSVSSFISATVSSWLI